MKRLHLLCVISLLLSASPVPAAERHALILCNQNYTAVGALKTPLAEAKAAEETLKTLGFAGNITVVTDASTAKMTEAVDTFASKLGKADVALFFYGGHAVQVAGENYLLGVDSDPATASQLAYKALPLGRVLTNLEGSGAQLNLLILDCCRDNPLPANGRSIGSTRGLAAVANAPKGTFIAYAADANQQAWDDHGQIGLYGSVLFEKMKTPGLRLEDIFIQTREEVAKIASEKYQHHQQPAEYSKVSGAFYFAGTDSPMSPASLMGAYAELTRLTTEAEQGNAKAQRHLAFRYQTGDGIGKDPAKALHWFLKAAGQDDPDAAYELAGFYFLDAEPKNPDEAMKWLRKAATLGHAAAQGLLGKFLCEGRWGKQDISDGVTWLQKAVKQDDRRAQGALGLLYLEGVDSVLKRDVPTGLKLLQLGASSGDSSAQLELGVLYLTGGNGMVPKNSTEGQRLLEECATKGNAEAQAFLGVVLLDVGGELLPRNPGQGLKWSRMAASQNHPKGQVNLGMAYMDGNGVPRDDVEALKWYRLAADQGHPKGMLFVGSMYEKGWGVKADIAAAIEWYRKAAAAGDDIAPKALERLSPKPAAAKKSKK
jgi:TPR repeat protein